jgi:hypothetical protein
LIYFIRRIFTLLKSGGFQTLIFTNTIAQGVAQEGGLDEIKAVIVSTLSFSRTKSASSSVHDEQLFRRRRPTGRITSVIKGGGYRPADTTYIFNIINDKYGDRKVLCLIRWRFWERNK